MAEWGSMVASRFRSNFQDWWLATFPGLAILTVVMGFNFLGDGLRDALDPRSFIDEAAPRQPDGRAVTGCWRSVGWA